MKRLIKKIDYKMAFIGQYLSMMNSFYLNLPTIAQKSYQNSFYEKINLTAQNFLFVFSTFVICFSLAMLEKGVSKKKS
jgi:hypothetical protein